MSTSIRDLGKSEHLSTEADVETFFVIPLLKYLGFSYNQIQNKHALDSLSVKSVKSTKKENYKPDFAIKLKRKVRLIVEAKAPSERLSDHVSQPREYTTILNGAYEDENPVRYFVLTNGHHTKLYRHDYNDPIVELDLRDVVEGNRTFEDFKNHLKKQSLTSPDDRASGKNVFTLRKAPLQDVNAAFSWCHQYIYRTDNISQGAAFSEFVKLITLKLTSDKHIRESYFDQMSESEIRVSPKDVQFSVRWIDERRDDTPNPMDSILFHTFIQKMEREIDQKTRKRIFNKNDHINLSPETIRGVVEKLEGLFLFGIDADLNGRLFETFLNATMRGKDLGQYFTPRSIVKLGVGLGRLHVDPTDMGRKSTNTERVLDACCGTGGFLIDALADMWRQIENNSSLTPSHKKALKSQIADNHIYGIDVGKDPNLSRIARLNMYLHGDGGSSIFNVDALDKDLIDAGHDSADVSVEKTELRTIYDYNGGYFDVVLTNPPFAKVYKLESSRNENELSTATRILQQYALRTWDDNRPKPSLKSSMMFFERYHDLLKPGGRLISVIDDGLLSGSDSAWFRKFLLHHFVINAVVSLPGDAFQRSKARVKTSLIVLRKKSEVTERQPDVFMYACRFIGIDDPSRQRSLPADRALREKAKREIEDVLDQYDSFCRGKGKRKFIVKSDTITDRLDVKYCSMKRGSRTPTWKRKKLNVRKLSDLVNVKDFAQADVIRSDEHNGTVRYVRIRYDGLAELGEEVEPFETTYSQMWRVREGDIVISNIAATYGSVAVIDEVTSGCVVTGEYTVLTANDGYQPLTVWAILRSKAARAEFLLSATGANRTRIKWDTIKDISIPYPILKRATEFSKRITSLNNREKKIREDRQQELRLLNDELDLDTDQASKILDAFKPPK